MTASTEGETGGVSGRDTHILFSKGIRRTAGEMKRKCQYIGKSKKTKNSGQAFPQWSSW